MDRGEFQKAYGKIVAKAWADEAFKERLVSNPNTVLKENGIDVPEGVQFKVVELTKEVIHLILPPHPDSEDVGFMDCDERKAAEPVASFCCW